MTEETNKVITINDVDYTEDQLTDQQKVIINHISDLDRKIRNTQFSLDQLTVGKEAFVKMLTDSLESEAE
jgi:NADH/NAD ratio-sensing transcriptional regulator Rex